jgi:hypothetical protein
VFHSHSRTKAKKQPLRRHFRRLETGATPEKPGPGGATNAGESAWVFGHLAQSAPILSAMLQLDNYQTSTPTKAETPHRDDTDWPSLGQCVSTFWEACTT